MNELYKHKHPNFHEKLGYGILIKKVSEHTWIIKWINTGNSVCMHPNWLEAVNEQG